MFTSIIYALALIGLFISFAKIPLLTFEAANLGMKFMISRLCLSLIGIVVIAMLVNLTVNEADLPILDE